MVNIVTLREEIKIEKEERKRLILRKKRIMEKIGTLNIEENSDLMGLETLLWEEVNEIQKRINEQSNVISLLEKSMLIIQRAICHLKGIELKVYYLQRYRGKSLLEISDELDYEYGYIRKISSRINKEKREQIGNCNFDEIEIK